MISCARCVFWSRTYVLAVRDCSFVKAFVVCRRCRRRCEPPFTYCTYCGRAAREPLSTNIPVSRLVSRRCANRDHDCRLMYRTAASTTQRMAATNAQNFHALRASSLRCSVSCQPSEVNPRVIRIHKSDLPLPISFCNPLAGGPMWRYRQVLV